MTRPRETCAHCGKRSGLDDIVSNAIDQGVHSKNWMIDGLVNGPPDNGKSVPHKVNCSGCATRFTGTFAWHNNDGAVGWYDY